MTPVHKIAVAMHIRFQYRHSALAQTPAEIILYLYVRTRPAYKYVAGLYVGVAHSSVPHKLISVVLYIIFDKKATEK